MDCQCHSSILRLRALFSRSLSELSALINNSETSLVEEFCSSKELQTFTQQREKQDRKFRKKDPDRLVLSAEKGNCVVVMEKQQYHDKALSLLNDKSTYTVFNSDPTSKTQRKLNKMLLDLKKAGKISDSTYKMLYSSDGLCPRFYGLPKIHKPGIPLRPIVSFVNSPTYAISGYLARILSPVAGNTDYTVKSSCELTDFTR